MSKTGHTKNRILQIIGSQQNVTLTHISEQLGLNPSTVSQHIQELKDMGAVTEIRNAHIKKWKYYRLDPQFDQRSLASPSGAQDMQVISRKVALYAVAVGLVAILLAAYLVSFGGFAAAHKSSLVRVSLTDPPDVPAGTSALYINYSSISLQVVDNGSTQWVKSNQSGTIDLMKLINFSQFVAGINVPVGSQVKLLKLNITSGRILINGSSYNLILRDNEILTNITGSVNTNKTSDVLVDLSPIVTPMYINGQTVLVMIPQVSSVTVLLNNSASNSTDFSKLSPGELRILRLTDSNLSISSLSLKTQNQQVLLNVTVKNDGNKTVVLKDILILGRQNVSYANGTQVVLGSLPVSTNHMGVEFSVGDNGTLNFTDNSSLSTSLVRVNYEYPYQAQGYVLAPNSSVVLQFSGGLPELSGTKISLIKSISYKITVLGDHVGKLVANTTAN